MQTLDPPLTSDDPESNHGSTSSWLHVETSVAPELAKIIIFCGFLFRYFPQDASWGRESKLLEFDQSSGSSQISLTDMVLCVDSTLGFLLPLEQLVSKALTCLPLISSKFVSYCSIQLELLEILLRIRWIQTHEQPLELFLPQLYTQVYETGGLGR